MKPSSQTETASSRLCKVCGVVRPLFCICGIYCVRCISFRRVATRSRTQLPHKAHAHVTVDPRTSAQCPAIVPDSPSPDGQLGDLKKLVAMGADVNAMDEGGHSAAYIACQNGFTSVLAVLKDGGADLNAARKDGWTPAHTACVYGHIGCLKVLKEGGADFDKADHGGATPAYIACQKVHMRDPLRSNIHHRASFCHWSPLLFRTPPHPPTSAMRALATPLSPFTLHPSCNVAGMARATQSLVTAHTLCHSRAQHTTGA